MVLCLPLSLLVLLAASAKATALGPRQLAVIAGVNVNGTGVAPSGTGIVPVALSADQQSYYVVAQAGNISFRLALDTGSADTWILSTACADKSCQTIPRYPLSYASPTFGAVNGNNTAFNVSFADGTRADGFVATETLALANVSAPGQVLGLAAASTVRFDSEISGVLGLSFPRLASIAQGPPLLAALAQRGRLAYPLMGLSLARGGGSLALGAVDGSVLTNASAVSWHAVFEWPPFAGRNESGYLHWAVALDGIGVNGTAVRPEPTYANFTGGRSVALFDVGQPGILGPYQDVSRMYAAIPDARIIDDTIGQWAIPCDTALTMSFTFGKTNFTLQPADYVIGPAAGNPNFCLTWPRARLSSGDGLDWSFGQAFLRTVYSVWSVGIDGKEPPTLGLYPLTNASAPAPALVPAPTTLAPVPTTLPNFFVSTPSPSATPLVFASTGALALVGSGLGASTYAPLLEASGTLRANVLGLSSVQPPPTAVTLTLTDAAGTHTSVSALPTASVALGHIPGSSNTGSRTFSFPGSPKCILSLFVAVSFSLYL